MTLQSWCLPSRMSFFYIWYNAMLIEFKIHVSIHEYLSIPHDFAQAEINQKIIHLHEINSLAIQKLVNNNMMNVWISFLYTSHTYSGLRVDKNVYTHTLGEEGTKQQNKNNFNYPLTKEFSSYSLCPTIVNKFSQIYIDR